MKKQCGWLLSRHGNNTHRHPEFSSGSMWMLNQVQHDVKRRTQYGRSMIEMLGVLAIVGVLSIGGIALYRRAVNNHHANTILDDVNRFAFVITERGNFTIDAEIPKGDFKESGLYTLKGYQAESGQYSITVKNVPKGVCELLVDKGVIDYKVGVVTAGHDVTEEILFDTLHTDLCQETSDVAFYFGDTSAVCNGNEDEPAECTTNADCCGGSFCHYIHATDSNQVGEGNGECQKIELIDFERITVSNKVWTRSTNTMNFWSAENWCITQGLKPVRRVDIGCGDVSGASYCTQQSTIFQSMREKWGNKGQHWLEDMGNDYNAYSIYFSSQYVGRPAKFRSCNALCY